jgi:hypothetical protein
MNLKYLFSNFDLTLFIFSTKILTLKSSSGFKKKKIIIRIWQLIGLEKMTFIEDLRATGWNAHSFPRW